MFKKIGKSTTKRIVWGYGLEVGWFQILSKLALHYKSIKFIEDFVGRARFGPIILEQANDVTPQLVKFN